MLIKYIIFIFPTNNDNCCIRRIAQNPNSECQHPPVHLFIPYTKYFFRMLLRLGIKTEVYKIYRWFTGTLKKSVLSWHVKKFYLQYFFSLTTLLKIYLNWYISRRCATRWPRYYMLHIEFTFNLQEQRNISLILQK